MQRTCSLKTSTENLLKVLVEEKSRRAKQQHQTVLPHLKAANQRSSHQEHILIKEYETSNRQVVDSPQRNEKYSLDESLDLKDGGRNVKRKLNYSQMGSLSSKAKTLKTVGFVPYQDDDSISIHDSLTSGGD
jgi:hypothetical protein